MKIKKEFKGNVGLFLVCAELSKRNLIAMPTSRNTKGYDVIVLNPETNRSIGIQVKCSDRREFPVFSSYWKNYKEKIDEKVISPFVFADISDINNPAYYVLTKDEVKSLMEEKNKKKPELWALKLSDVEKYKNNWNSIIDLLK